MFHPHKMRNRLLPAAAALLAALSLAACAQSGLLTAAIQSAAVTEAGDAEAGAVQTAEPAAEPAASTDGVERPAGWSEASHGSDAEPNYAVVFPQDKVNRITITIDPEQWEAMQADMTELYGEKGAGGPGGMGGPMGGERPAAPPEGWTPPEGFEPPAEGEMPEGFAPPEGFPQGFEPGRRPPGGPGGMGGDFTTENPMWVEATVEFDGQTWTHVGVRYKGNSTLMSAWRSGSLKLPFKFDFDEWEDDYPEIKNQRFYGFKQLSLGNNAGDSTYMHDALAYDLLEEAGLPAAETAFYEVTLDYGEGPVSLGIYTVVEVIDDTVVEKVFGDDSGNLYEADGRAATLAAGVAAQIEESFQKENNEDGDWSDIEELHATLNSELRTTDPEAWMAEMEAIFDVDTFLEWLAVSAVMQHWDTYGGMNHNWYIYDNPETGQLTWISWDHDHTFEGGGGMGGPMGGFRPGGPAGQDERAEQAGQADPAAQERFMRRGGPGLGGSSLDKADVGEEWPLIRYLLDQPEYSESYVSYMAAFMDEVFTPDELAAKVQAWGALLAPYAEAAGDAQYAERIESLAGYFATRAGEVESFLAGQ